MRMSGQASRVTVGNVVSALAIVATFGGYVLVVGAVVAWLDVRTIGVPAISVVADMPRNELLGLGFETLAVWLLLGPIVAGAAISLGTTAHEAPGRPLVVLVASTVIAGLLAAAWQFDSVLASVAVSLGLVALAVLLAWVGERKFDIFLAVGTDIAAVVGVALGVGLELLLINPGKIVGFMVALVAVLVAVWLAARIGLQHRFAERRSAFEDESFEVTQLGADERERAWRQRELQSMLGDERIFRRWSVVAAALLAIVLAGGAVVSRRSYDFWAARVMLTNGTCASGTLLVRNSDEVLLAGLKHKTAGGQVENRLVEIPASVISSVQVIGPRGPARRFTAESCAKAASDLHPRSFAPYPLVGDSSAAEVDPPVSTVPGPEGREGKEGKRGPKGERGPGGTRGVAGERGTTGKTGKARQPGGTGKTGKTGPTGNIGPTGMTGATGRPGVWGERGPPGSRGERGSKGERGERGPRGFSSVGGS
jgi:hypothetical protein